MKQKKRKKRLNPNTVLIIRKIVGGLLMVILIAVLVSSVWYLTRLQSLTIQTVNVSGGQTISHDLVRTLAEAELEGEYMRLIPKRFSLFYPKQRILNTVEEVNRIKNISVQRENPTTLVIIFDEFVPDSLWCSEGATRCVFVDSKGYAFAKAPSLTGGSFLRLDKLGVEPVTDVQAFDDREYNQIKQIVKSLENNSWFIESVEVDVAGDAYLTLTKGGELKVALSDASEQIVENLFTVLSSPEFSEIEPGNFQYIDLRFGNKVFVNENELEPENEDTASSTDDAVSE